jgi:pimeloyl-ACP methyl ester carboxylesterase
MPIRDEALQLDDGRLLAFAEWGNPDGDVVLFFHGSPHSRLWCPDEAATQASGVRLITVDRPGVGRSDVLPRRTFSHWPSDVIQLADALGLERFGVIGWSNGGSYAAVCGALIPDRLVGVGIACTGQLATFNMEENPSRVAELDEDEQRWLELGHSDPDELLRVAVAENGEWMQEVAARPEKALEDFEPVEADRWFFDDADRRHAFLEAMREAVRQGPEAIMADQTPPYLPWGFRLAEVTPEVHLWHGEHDYFTDPRDVEFIAETLPRSRLEVWDDAGHQGVARYWADILQAVRPDR